MIFTDQRRTQRKKGYFCCGEIRQFVEDCPNKPKPKDIKKARRVRRQGLTTIKTWDDSSSEEEASGTATSLYRALFTFAS
jgi:hypothetical protein